MKKIKVLALCAVALGIVTSCQKNETFEEVQPETSSEISDEHKVALIAAGINPLYAIYTTQEFLGGEKRKGILAGSEVNRDMFIPFDQLQDLALESTSDGNKQYRTNNLVSQNKVITIIGFTGNSSQGLTQREQDILEQSINEYNALSGVNISFDLTFGSNWQDKDMVIYDDSSNFPGRSGGIAEFPSGGDPGRFVRFYGLSSTSTSFNVYETIMKHEIGHALGFRHTDYARRACDGINEGSSNVGAILVDGTPSENRWGFSGIDSRSIMISCVQPGANGEFTSDDVRALQEMY